jgi:glutamine---fructose-6-phosphate transaminase (isomerizing)
MMAMSQSGETKDVHRAVKIAMENDVPALSIVNTVGSLIARTTQLGVYLNAGREHAVASTKAFSSQVTVLALVAIWFRHQREMKENLPELHLKGELVEALQRLPISFGMALKTRPKCKEIAEVSLDFCGGREEMGWEEEDSLSLEGGG